MHTHNEIIILLNCIAFFAFATLPKHFSFYNVWNEIGDGGKSIGQFRERERQVSVFDFGWWSCHIYGK